MFPDSPLCRLPTELIIAVATLLDVRSLVYFKSTCRALQNVVNHTSSLKYTLALAERGLCDGAPSPVTVTKRLELVEAYEEAWRTFSWSKYLSLELSVRSEGPYVSGGTVILSIFDISGRPRRTFVVQSIPSPLRGIPGRRWQIDFDFMALYFVIDATQDLFFVMPNHDITALYVRALSTGQPHALSANEGVLRLEPSHIPATGNSKHEICGDFLGIITWRSDKRGYDSLLIWNWKTGVLHVNMPILRSRYNTAFTFLDDRHFVIPSVRSGRRGDIVLNVYQFCPCPRPCPQRRCQQALQETLAGILVRDYVLSVSDVLRNIRALRFFPDVSAGASAGAASPPGHFYADPSKRVFGIQVEATSRSTKQVTAQALLIPLRALSGLTRELSYRRTSVFYEPLIGQYEYGSGAVTAERRIHIPPEKLPPALRGVEESQWQYAVCCGAVLVFEHAHTYVQFPGKLHILAF